MRTDTVFVLPSNCTVLFQMTKAYGIEFMQQAHGETLGDLVVRTKTFRISSDRGHQGVD